MKYFEEYQNTKKGFDLFNNEVINMPRPNFSNIGFEYLKLISRYLLFYKNNKATEEYYTYKDIYAGLLEGYQNEELNISKKFEDQYFKPFKYSSVDIAYDSGVGRMFRHVMGTGAFFGLIESKSRRQKRINEIRCNEFSKAPIEIVDKLKRSSLLSITVKNNNYINQLSGIKDYLNSDYNPTYAILNYINLIGRPVTDFEISILLGRLDRVNSQYEILSRALEIGKNMPKERGEQIDYFFRQMGWVSASGNLFSYASSQEPFFKFKVYLLYMVEFDLLVERNEKFELSQYSMSLLNQDIEPYLIDLENLLDSIERFDNSNEIMLTVLNSETLTIERLLSEEEDLTYKLGKRSLKERETVLKFGGTPKRNNLIMFFAKFLGNHTCQISTSFTNKGIEFHKDVKSFRTRSSKWYTEGHHILELKEDNGPDIIENILLVDPNTHRLIHNGHDEEKKELFKFLKDNDVITVDRFANIIYRYNCLNHDHIHKLKKIGVINQDEAIYLLTEISNSNNQRII